MIVMLIRPYEQYFQSLEMEAMASITIRLGDVTDMDGSMINSIYRIFRSIFRFGA